jgi:hypothetical protein
MYVLGRKNYVAVRQSCEVTHDGAARGLRETSDIGR